MRPSSSTILENTYIGRCYNQTSPSLVDSVVALIPSRSIRQMLTFFSGVEFLNTVSKFRKRKRKSFSCAYVLQKTSNQRHFHVVVVQRRQKKYTNLESGMDEQSCSIVKINMIINTLTSFLFLCYLFIRKRVILLLISFKLITFVRLAVFCFFFVFFLIKQLIR